MRKLRLFGALALAIILALGVSGCMKTPKQRDAENQALILAYLEETYGMSFTVTGYVAGRQMQNGVTLNIALIKTNDEPELEFYCVQNVSPEGIHYGDRFLEAIVSDKMAVEFSGSFEKLEGSPTIGTIFRTDAFESGFSPEQLRQKSLDDVLTEIRCFGLYIKISVEGDVDYFSANKGIIYDIYSKMKAYDFEYLSLEIYVNDGAESFKSYVRNPIWHSNKYGTKDLEQLKQNAYGYLEIQDNASVTDVVTDEDSILQFVKTPTKGEQNE